jgi:multiple sugar transport system substrate-binding protein
MKKVLSVLIVCIMVLGITGCGNVNNLDNDGEQVTLKIGLPNGKQMTPNEIVESFKEENPNIRVETDETPWNEFKRKLKMQIAASNPPDVFVMDSGYVATLGGMGAVIDLNDRINEDLNIDEYSSALFAGQDKDGKVWGVPHALNSVTVAYNKSIFDKYNEPYPEEDWTYEEMLDIAKRLTIDEDNDGETDIYGLITGVTITDGWLPFILSAGGAPLDETYTKSNFSNEKTILGLEKFVSTIKDGINPERPWVAANGGQFAAFYMGKAAMVMLQASNLNAINDNAPEGFSYDVEMLPIGWDGNRYCVYVPNQWSIFSRTSEGVQDAAWKWIVHFLGEESQNGIASLENRLPIRNSALEFSTSIKSAPENRIAFYKGIDEHGATLFESPAWEEWKPQVDAIVAEVLNGVKTVEQAIPEMDSIVQTAIDEVE